MDLFELNDLGNFAKPAFNKISAEKQKRIISVARAEFAENGLADTNINIVAKKAEVSVGSLYNYFEKKEDLFLTVACNGLEEVMSVMGVAANFSLSDLKNIKMFLKVLIRFIQEEHEICKLYNDVAYNAGNDATLPARKLTKEKLFEVYERVITFNCKKGHFRKDVNVHTMIFMLDAVFSSIRYTYTSAAEYDLKVFLPDEIKNDIDLFAENLAKLLLSAFCAPGEDVTEKGKE